MGVRHLEIVGIASLMLTPLLDVACIGSDSAPPRPFPHRIVWQITKVRGGGEGAVAFFVSLPSPTPPSLREVGDARTDSFPSDHGGADD